MRFRQVDHPRRQRRRADHRPGEPRPRSPAATPARTTRALDLPTAHHQPAGRRPSSPRPPRRHHHHDTARRAAPCPVDALDDSRRARRDHVLARPQRGQRDLAQRGHRPVQRQPGPRGVAPRTRAATSRRSTSTSSRARTTDRRRHVARVHVQRRSTPAAPSRSARAPRPPASTPARASSRRRSPLQHRRRAVGHAVQRVEPGLLYNSNMFVAAGLDPERPPQSLEELRQYSQQLVDSGAATYGIAVDSGADSGGGWFIEQWFASMGELYADNGNGRLAPSTRCCTTARRRRVVHLRAGPDQRRSGVLRRRQRRRATSCSSWPTPRSRRRWRSVHRPGSARCSILGRRARPRSRPRRRRRRPAPGAGPNPCARRWSRAYSPDGRRAKRQPRGTSSQFMVSAETQSLFATLTGYVPGARRRPRDRASLDGVRRRSALPGRVRPAGDVTRFDPALQGPILGPQREIRAITARVSPRCSPGATCRPR